MLELTLSWPRDEREIARTVKLRLCSKLPLRRGGEPDIEFDDLDDGLRGFRIPRDDDCENERRTFDLRGLEDSNLMSPLLLLFGETRL